MYELCRHIKTNGLQCEAPKLRQAHYCYFHNRIHQSHAPTRMKPQSLQIGITEDREAVQVAISTVLNALATDQLETRKATALLYGLQLASMNAARLDTASYRMVRESDPDDPTLALPGAISHRDDEAAALMEAYLDDEEEEDTDEDYEDEE